jgi:serpin B
MKKIEVFLRTVIIFLMILCLPILSSGKEPSAGAKTLVRGNTEFALEMYSKLKQEKGNIFFSPYSISSAMGMVYAGARGETEKQMAKTLRFFLNQQDIHPEFAELNAELNKLQDNDLRLSVANSLWTQQDYKFSDDYLALTQKHYGVSVTPVDYIHAAEKARSLINQWVSDKTENKIREILQPGELDPLTRLVLVNAIYFKGRWENQFEKRVTIDAPFYLAASKSVQVPTMGKTSWFRYDETDNLQILEMPYVGRNISMIILLPKEIYGLRQIENYLSFENFEKWRKLPERREVLVFLPKFKMTSQFELKKILQQMGMVDTFSIETANFSSMNGKNCASGNPDCLYISDAIHKAYVDVDEGGTEAAAVTADTGIRGAAADIKPFPPTFRADHPFLFLIQDRQSGGILFMGRVTDPSKAVE